MAQWFRSWDDLVKESWGRWRQRCLSFPMCNLFSEYVSDLVLPPGRTLIIFLFPLVPVPTSLLHGSVNSAKGGETQEMINLPHPACSLPSLPAHTGHSSLYPLYNMGYQFSFTFTFSTHALRDQHTHVHCLCQGNPHQPMETPTNQRVETPTNQHVETPTNQCVVLQVTDAKFVIHQPGVFWWNLYLRCVWIWAFFLSSRPLQFQPKLDYNLSLPFLRTCTQTQKAEPR